MEILFKDKNNARPVYDFQIKQEWEKHVSYQCPAKLTPAELKAIERVCRETFAALDCRDVARVDLRMTPKGDIYVLEVNPLPGLTPGYSDLCLIAKAAGIEYRTLIGEILDGGLKRLREKRREAKSEAKSEAKLEAKASDQQGRRRTATARPTAAARRNGSGAGTRRQTPAPATTASDDASIPAGMRARLRDLGFSIGHFPVGPPTRSPTSPACASDTRRSISGEGPLEVGKGPVRTGVTAVIPRAEHLREPRARRAASCSTAPARSRG